MTILKRTVGTHPDPRRSPAATTAAASADTAVRCLLSRNAVKHFLRYVTIHHGSAAHSVCWTRIWEKKINSLIRR